MNEALEYSSHQFEFYCFILLKSINIFVITALFFILDGPARILRYKCPNVEHRYVHSVGEDKVIYQFAVEKQKHSYSLHNLEQHEQLVAWCEAVKIHRNIKSKQSSLCYFTTLKIKHVWLYM